MSGFLRSLSRSSSSVHYSNQRSYGRLGPVGNYESTPFNVRVSKKLRVVRLDSHRAAKKEERLGQAGQSAQKPSSKVLRRLRDVYEKVMTKAASKSGETSAIPIAKKETAPPTLAFAFGSRRGTRVSELDPGFKMTAAEKKYVEHLRRTAANGNF